MDLLLELPLDAVASRLHSLPAVLGLLSTWVAVLAAALGLWRIRVVGSSKSRCAAAPAASFAGLASHAHELVASEPERAHPPQASSEDMKRDCAEPTTSPSPRCVAAEGTTTTKTRFVAYYDSDDDGVGDDGEETEEQDVGSDFCCGGGAVAAPWRGDWASLEGVVMARRGDLGWYCYQDRTALNGSVVRLWDGGRDGGPFTARRRRIAW